MSLPLIPGLVFSHQLGKEKFHKSHHFDNLNSINYMFGTHKPGIGGDPLPGQRIDAPVSHYPSSAHNSRTPAWVAFDKQVLSFHAYYKESVNESRLEQYRIRTVKILFYLEDDTVQVIEPRMRNSGLPQGTIIKRHRIAKPTPENHLYFTVHDFNVGIDVCFYDRVFRIVSCDQFTENFLRKMGTKIGYPEAVPDDQYNISRKAMEESMQPRRPYDHYDTFRQFLDHDRHVLRFFCFWDDSDNLYGDPREMILNYFLADDTIEIREIIPKNAGRDAAPTFLRRQKLPKRVEPMPEVGSKTEKILLNVLGHPQRGGRVLVDSLKTGLMNPDYYTDADLTIGSYINVYGRKFVICSMDEFTKEYYRTKYGIKNFNEVRYTLHKGIPIRHQDPPYNGWGTEIDSLGNCRGLIPEAPKGDFVKFLIHDKRGFDLKVLRFNARMVTEHPIDKTRQFVIAYFFSDDTILIYEPPVRNSGIQGGKFLERSKIKKPGQERFSTELPEYYLAQDLYVGAVVEINDFIFILEDADEYAFQYMETHPHEFQYSNITRILEKMRPKAVGKRAEMLAFFDRQDKFNNKTVNMQDLVCILRQIYSESELNDHEIITIARKYAFKSTKPVNVDELIGVAQQELRKISFEDFGKFREACFMSDTYNKGTLSREDLRAICKVFKFTFPENLLQGLFDASQSLNDPNEICYERFIWLINWRENPYPAPCEPDLPIELAYNWQPYETAPVGKNIPEGIMYEPFVMDLTPDKINTGSAVQCTPVSEDRPY